MCNYLLDANLIIPLFILVRSVCDPCREVKRCCEHHVLQCKFLSFIGGRKGRKSVSDDSIRRCRGWE